MSDLISRDAARNAVRNLGEDYVARLKMLLLIEEVPSAEPEWKWIPVTEALPEEETEVLVTVRFDGMKDMKGSIYVEIAHQIDGEWSSYSDEYKVLAHRHHVIAWMPLPEPWRGDR